MYFCGTWTVFQEFHTTAESFVLDSLSFFPKVLEFKHNFFFYCILYFCLWQFFSCLLEYIKWPHSVSIGASSNLSKVFCCKLLEPHAFCVSFLWFLAQALFINVFLSNIITTSFIFHFFKCFCSFWGLWEPSFFPDTASTLILIQSWKWLA